MPKLIHPMLTTNTPVQDYTSEYGLWVKREDMSCPPPGPPFSKTRGVYSHISKRRESIIGVLDTYHSQAGHAVARACQVLGKKCINYYPEFKYEPGPREPQLRAKELGAEIVGIPAGRSAILFHRAKSLCSERGGYIMPNALKIVESVDETAKEVPTTKFDTVIIPASSGTIAAGVIKGFCRHHMFAEFIVHLGYSRPKQKVMEYLRQMSGISQAQITIVDENYAYKDMAKAGLTPPWPCNAYYDLKAFRWYLANKPLFTRKLVLFWNIG